MRSAAATLSGVSLIVSALLPGTGAIRRAPSTTRSRSIVSLRSAFERNSVLTTCCSKSLRLDGVSGTTFSTFESTTRWKVRPAAASAGSAWAKPTVCRSRGTLASWNEGAKGRGRVGGAAGHLVERGAAGRAHGRGVAHPPGDAGRAGVELERQAVL